MRTLGERWTKRFVGGVLPLILGLAAAAVAKTTPSDAESAARRFEAATGLRIRFDSTTSGAAETANVAGKPLSDKQRVETVERLLPWIARYPLGFVGRVVDEVVVLNDLVVDGVLARGHRNDRRIYLQFDGPDGHLGKGDLDHEIFHALDGRLAELKVSRAFEDRRQRAVRLRDLWEDYRLTPSHRYTFNWNTLSGKAPWVAYVPVVGFLWMFGHDRDGSPPGFASRRGMVAPREDRATVAEALLAGDDGFLRRASDDRELREKVAIVRAIYEAATEGAMGSAFWAKLAGGPADVPSLGDLEARLAAVATPARILAPVSAGGEVVSVEPVPAQSPAVTAVTPPPLSDPFAEEPLVLAGPPVRAVVVAAALPTPASSPHSTPRASPTPSPQSTSRGTPTPPPAVANAAEPTASPAGSPPTRARGPAAEYAEGTAAFRSGDHARAARIWREMLAEVNPEYATIQIAINCAFENVVKNQQALAASTSFYALAYRHSGRDCHLSLTGLYRDRDDAALAIAGLPAEIREQKPRPISMRELWARVPLPATQGVERNGNR